MTVEELDASMERVLEQKEHVHAEGRHFVDDAFVYRGGEEELGLALIPNTSQIPTGTTIDAAGLMLGFLRIAIPGIWADSVTMATDTFSMGSMEGIDRHARRRIRRKLEKEFGGRMQNAYEAGLGEEMGIFEAMAVIVAERNKTPDELPKIYQKVIPYHFENERIVWDRSRTWSHVDQGQASERATGRVIDGIRRAFAGENFLEFSRRAWPVFAAEKGIDPGDPDDINRTDTDLMIIKELVRSGCMVAPMLPKGERSTYFDERMQEMAEQLGGTLIKGETGSN